MRFAKKVGLIIAAGGLCGLILGTPNLGITKFKDKKAIPNGKSYSCKTCHGKGSYKDLKNLTPFGKDYMDNNHVWDSTLANMDSDGDGKTNGWELGDEEGVWKKGDKDTDPGRQIYNPGKKDSF